MDTVNILLVIFSVLLALGLSYYQYIHQAKNHTRVVWFLAFLRFISLLVLLILLINPKISREITENIRPTLYVFLDNSSSIKELKQSENVLKVYQTLSENEKLNEHFSVQYFTFGKELKRFNDLGFNEKSTQIAPVADYLKNAYSQSALPVVLVTDGNQTQGKDYIHSFPISTPVFPVVVGDTIPKSDLQITQVNVNEYALLNNRFPVEIFVNYSGNQKSVNTEFIIEKQNQVVYKEKVSFLNHEKSKVLNTTLLADKIGLQSYKLYLRPFSDEKNTYNNTKNMVVEVINQKSKMAIITNLTHPDIGVLRRSIEKNKFREVQVLKPTEVKEVSDYDLLIFYQPNITFTNLFQQSKSKQINSWVITGKQTDYSWLNQVNSDYTIEAIKQTENYKPILQADFSLFSTEDNLFSNYPPLENSYLRIQAKVNTKNMLHSSVRNVTIQMPLFSFVENNTYRRAYLFGENIWKWRMQSYLDTQKFDAFDGLINQVVQYLSSKDAKKRLVVHAEKWYNSSERIEIAAQFFNKNYELDTKALLTINLTHLATNKKKQFDLLKSDQDFKVYFEDLAVGKYQYKIIEKGSQESVEGYFEVLAYDMEKHFVHADYYNLKQLAEITNGKLFVPSQTNQLIEELLKNENYKPIQKTVIKNTPLIDWKYLLISLVFLLAVEWFVRKYNGLL